MRLGLIAATAMLVVSCGSEEDAAEAPPEPIAEAPSQSGAPELGSTTGRLEASAERWDLQTSGEGVLLSLLRRERSATIRLVCPAGEGQLVVNVPAFRPIGSEERLAFGSDGGVVALVADTRGDARRGGVSGMGEVPNNLPALISGRVSASYGAQTSGPHSAPPQDLARTFVDACTESSPAMAQNHPQPAGPTGACLTQGSERLGVAPLRAVGTEPFWAARIEGRCVNYSHPEDPHGTRVWTRYTEAPGGGTWSGALGGQLFELRTRTEPGCSDGMSDKRYPLAVELTVHGERRRGCAEPI